MRPTSAFRVRARLALLAGGVMLWSGCLSSVPIVYEVEPTPAVYGCAQGCADSDAVAVTYLGVSGFTIAYHGHVLLTAPLFSNPSLDAVTPSGMHWLWRAPTITPDTRRIERLLPAEADAASMVLVGHGHYDHLLDVPYVVAHRVRRAVVVGSPTVRHMLMGDSALRADPGRVLAVSGADVGTATRAGRWLYDRDSSFRVMALEADHAPTFRFLWWTTTFADGVVTRDLTSLPRAAEDWKAGEPYSYLIDVLARGDTAPRFRIYYQDAPNSAPKGFPPGAVIDGRPVDLAILCVATARHTRPESPDPLLMRIQPRYVIASHWESFFRPQTYPLMLNPMSDVDAWVASLEKSLPPSSSWAMPLPRTRLRYATTR